MFILVYDEIEVSVLTFSVFPKCERSRYQFYIDYNLFKPQKKQPRWLTVMMCLDIWFVFTEQQRFQTQSPHFVHSPWHQWHPLDMSHLQDGPEKRCARSKSMTAWIIPSCYLLVFPRFLWEKRQALVTEVRTRGAGGHCRGRHDPGCWLRPVRCCSARTAAARLRW